MHNGVNNAFSYNQCISMQPTYLHTVNPKHVVTRPHTITMNYLTEPLHLSKPAQAALFNLALFLPLPPEQKIQKGEKCGGTHRGSRPT